MIKKNKSGQIVEFVDEKVFGDDQKPVREGAKDQSTAVSARRTPTTRDEIDFEFEVSVAEATEKSVLSLNDAMKELEGQVVVADEVAKAYRQTANEKLAQAKRDAEKRMREAIAAAEVVRDAEVAEIRAAFYTTMNPINARAQEIKEAHHAALKEILAGLAVVRQQQISELAAKEAAKKAEREAVKAAPEAPAPTAEEVVTPDVPPAA